MKTAASMLALAVTYLLPLSTVHAQALSFDEGLAEAVEFIKGGAFAKATRGYQLAVRRLTSGYAVDFQRFGKTRATLEVTGRGSFGGDRGGVVKGPDGKAVSALRQLLSTHAVHYSPEQYHVGQTSIYFVPKRLPEQEPEVGKVSTGWAHIRFGDTGARPVTSIGAIFADPKRGGTVGSFDRVFEAGKPSHYQVNLRNITNAGLYGTDLRGRSTGTLRPIVRGRGAR